MSKPKALTVLPLGGKSNDTYRFTPVELYELGKRHFAKKDFASAGRNLTELLAKWNVNPDIYKDAVQMLLDIHLELGPPAEIVRYFEIIKEKWPELEIPFDKIMKVGAAYHEMGEYERSYLVFRATVESSFLRESGVAGFLEAQGEFVRSVEVMNRLLAEYPPEPYSAAPRSPWRSGSTPRRRRRPPTPSCARRRSTASTWCSRRWRCWSAS